MAPMALAVLVLACIPVLARCLAPQATTGSSSFIFSALSATKGVAQRRIHTILGVPRIREICQTLEQAGNFKCDHVWSSGASGQLLGSNNIEWLPDELRRVTKKQGFVGVAGLEWTAGDNEELILVEGPRNALERKHKLPLFTEDHEVPLFQRSDRSLNRKLQLFQDKAKLRTITQHGANVVLGSLSAFSDACTARCNHPAKYKYSSTGTGVTIYVVDGHVADHEQFRHLDTGQSRIATDRHFSSAAQSTEGQSCASEHGTHVAALAAGYEFGTAKDATVVSVAVQPGCGMSGMASELEAGLDWVLTRHVAQPEPRPPAVVTMSLLLKNQHSAAGRALAEKVEELIEAGVVVVAAAGNYHQDACDYVPAGLPGVITVAAADVTHDATMGYPWSWSNFGPCVDIWAPGVDIESASPDCFECTAEYSGTSQATPMVAGLVAQYLSVKPRSSPANAKQALNRQAARSVLVHMGHPYDSTVNHYAQTWVGPIE